MANVATISIALVANSAKYITGLNRAGRRTNRFGKNAVKALNSVVKAFGLLAAVGIAAVVRASAEQEKAISQLEAGLKSTGNVAGKTSAELQKFAAQMQQTSTFGDEAVISLQSILLTFTQIRGVNFDRTTQSVIDLAARMNIDLQSAALQVAKALNDPIANLGALSRAGIQFSKDQKEVIKALAESGRLAEAQVLILDELETQFGGSAKAARETFTGALKGLQNAANDLLETGSGLPGLTTQINKITEALADPRTKAAIQNFFELFATGIENMLIGFRELPDFGRFIAEAFSLTQADAVTEIGERIDELRLNLKDVRLELDKGRGLGLGEAVDKFLGFDEETLRAKVESITAQIEALTQQQLDAIDRIAGATPETPAEPTAVVGGALPTAALENFEQRAVKVQETVLELNEAMRQRRILIEQEIQDATLAGQQVTNERLIEFAQELAERKLAIENEQRAIRGETALVSEKELNEQRFAAEIEFLTGLADARIKIKEQEEAEIAKLERQAADERLRTEQTLDAKIIALRKDVANRSLNVLRAFGQKNKTLAKASIILEKGVAIAKAIMNTGVAVTKALSIDPSGSLAARVAILGAAQVALIAATGIAQIQAVGAGGAAPGTAGGPPVFTAPAESLTGEEAPTGFQGGTVVQVTIQGDVVGDDESIDRLATRLGDAINERDVVIIGAESRQAIELTEEGT
jgi:hypothetical protein